MTAETRSSVDNACGAALAGGLVLGGLVLLRAYTLPGFAIWSSVLMLIVAPAGAIAFSALVRRNKES